MGSAERNLAERIRELRRRHFGPRGKSAFADRLGISEQEYTRYEEAEVPPGEILVRMCHETGEDLQWLLTGIAARGTMVIAGARDRDQHLLARITGLLNRDPAFGTRLAAFIDLLERGDEAREEVVRRLPLPDPRDLIPILDTDALPRSFAEGGPGQNGLFALERPSADCRLVPGGDAVAQEPNADGYGAAVCSLSFVGAATGNHVREYVQSGQLAKCFPDMFGMRVADASMTPMLEAGDVVLAAPSAPAQPGRPALCRLARGPVVCRIWLGPQDGEIALGRLADGGEETFSDNEVCWALEVLYRVRRAA